MTTAITDARRFKVERRGPFVIVESRQGWTVFAEQEWGWLHREGFFVDSAEEETTETFASWGRVVRDLYFPTEAEATFRLLLHQHPAEALGPFLRATGGEYQGTCYHCKGTGQNPRSRLWVPGGVRMSEQAEASRNWMPARDCDICHGTGGPPSPDLLGIAGDWFDERGCEMEAGVFHQLALAKS